MLTFVKPFKNRTLNIEEPVIVYRNLHGNIQEMYSIKQKNVVVAHTNLLSLKDCKFIVNPRGRRRAIKQKRRNPQKIQAYPCFQTNAMNSLRIKESLTGIITKDSNMKTIAIFVDFSRFLLYIVAANVYPAKMALLRLINLLCTFYFIQNHP